MDYWGIGGACSLQVLPSFSVGFGGLEVAFLYSLSKLFTWILHCNLGTWWQPSCREFLKFSPWILHFFLVVWWWLFCRVSLNYSLGFCIGVLVVWWKLFCRVFSKIFLWIWHWTWCFLVMAFHIFFLEFALDLFLLFHFCMVFCPLLHFSMDFVCVVGGFFVGCFLSFSGLCNGIWWGWWWLFLALSMPRQEQRGLDCDCLAVFSGLSRNETWPLSKAQSSPGYMQPPSIFRWPLEFLPEL